MQGEFEDLFDQYKAKFGATFSFFDVSRSEIFMERSIPLMQQALNGQRGPVTNADVGFNPPDEVVT